MATITLTDRISVRVTAKDSTETSNQNKTNGGNVATALGGTGLTDEEKESLGASLGDTVTDENGKTYARSDKIAGVLKQLSQDGKLSEPTTGYRFGNVAALRLADLPASKRKNGWSYGAQQYTRLMYHLGTAYHIYIDTTINIFTEQSQDIDADTYVAFVHLISEDADYIVLYGINRLTMVYGPEPSEETIEVYPSNYSNSSWSAYTESKVTNFSSYAGVIPTTDVGQVLSLSQYGGLHSETSGGAPLDPTGKTDGQIKQELEAAAAQHNAVIQPIGSNDAYIAVTDENGNPLYFLGT